MNIVNQGSCQSRKTAKIVHAAGIWRIFPTKYWRGIPSLGPEHSRRAARRALRLFGARRFQMLGKLAGAWLGEKIAGRNKGMKGAILGYGAAALAKRSVGSLAALALGGWAFSKWRQKRRARAAYPSEATPASPSS
jgi:hypothetical protein